MDNELDFPRPFRHPAAAMPASQEPSAPSAPVTAAADPDIFLSYAHSDDINGIGPALHAQLEGDLRPLLGRHVEIFLDRSDILDFHDWKVRCHRALRASGFFIVLLSPAYLRSDACRWEWEEWLKCKCPPSDRVFRADSAELRLYESSPKHGANPAANVPQTGFRY